MKERAEHQFKTKKITIESVKVEISSPCFNGVTFVNNNEFHMPVKWLGTVFQDFPEPLIKYCLGGTENHSILASSNFI